MKPKHIKKILLNEIKKVVSKVRDIVLIQTKILLVIVNFIWKKLLKE
jgi:hypothetical protein